MKIFSLITVALLGVSSVCAMPADEPMEFKLLESVTNLVQASVEELGGQANITREIFSILGKTATTDGRRALEDVDNEDLLGPDARSALKQVVEKWLDDLPVDIVGDVSGNGDGRKLQNPFNRFNPDPIIRSIECTIRSIFIENILYSQVEDLEDYSDNLVCLKHGKCDNGIKEIEFVEEHAKGNEFLYNSKGPCQLQGVFRLFYPNYCSSIVSFAETVEAFPLSTGELRNPFLPLFPDLPPAFTFDGFTYNVRVSGASNWAFSGDGSCYEFVKAVDLIYGLKPLRDPTLTTTFNSWLVPDLSTSVSSIDNPTGFVIVPSIKLGPLRLNIDSECTVDTFGWALLRFEMVLIEDCTDIDTAVFRGGDALAACNEGAVIWERKTYFFQSIYDPPQFIYYVIQIVDGFGHKNQKAYDDWVTYEGASGAPQPYVNAFRSLEKSEKSEKKCDKKDKSDKKKSKAAKGKAKSYKRRN